MSSPILRVIAAERRRRWSVHRWSTLASSVIFPAIMIAVLFYLPGADLSDQSLELRVAGLGIVGGAAQDPPRWATPLLERMEAQPLYRLSPLGDPVRAFEAGAVDAAIVLAPPEPAAPQGTITVHYREDLVSHVLVEAARRGDAAAVPLVRAEGAEAISAGASEDSLARVGLFVLLGFAWFFTSSGAIERFVGERERRSIEAVLALPLPIPVLLRGRLAEISLHGALPQVACGLTLLALGFPVTALLLPLVAALTLLPLATACFWILRDTEEMMSAGWKTGLAFMLGFPILILLSDALGPLSPFYRLARALQEVPDPAVVGPALAALGLLNGIAWWAAPRLGRRWGTA